MIKIQIESEHLNNLFFDEINFGKNQFKLENNLYVANISKEQFNKFMKVNNLIPYKNSLKHYEDGDIVAYFQTNI